MSVNKDVKGFLYAFVISSLITRIIAWAVLSPGTYKVMDGIYTVDFLGICNFDFYDRSVLPQCTIGFHCPRFDYMKIWPFPIEQPWDGEIIRHVPLGPEI